MSGGGVRWPGDQAMAGVPFAAAYPARRLLWSAPGLDAPLELAVVDARAVGNERGTFLLCHGEPTWSHLSLAWIPLRHVVDTLDLDRVHLVVQDWGGPIGLRQAFDEPDRFARIFVFDPWLQHAGFTPSKGLLWWRAAATDPAHFGGDMPTGAVVAAALQRPHDAAAVTSAYDAPFDGEASKAGARAFPAVLPFVDPERGGADVQQVCWDRFGAWDACPVHVAFGDADIVFTTDGAAEWAAHVPGATLDNISGARHFVQVDAPDDCLAVIGRHTGVAL